MAEIGEELGISRQGVHDAVKRIDKILLDYEDKLHYAKNYNKNNMIVSEIRSKISEYGNIGINLSDIEVLLDELDL